MVWEALATSTLSDTYNSVLFGVNDHTLLAHRFRVGYSGAKVPIPVQSAIKTTPIVVSVPSVGKTPRDQCIILGLMPNSTMTSLSLRFLKQGVRVIRQKMLHYNIDRNSGIIR